LPGLTRFDAPAAQDPSSSQRAARAAACCSERAKRRAAPTEFRALLKRCRLAAKPEDPGAIMPNVVPAVRTLLRRRTFVTAVLVTFVALSAMLFALGGEAAAVAATCSGGATYSVNSSAPPTANWTSTSSGLWVPGGNYPGAASCDSAVDAAGNAITITVDSAIPNNLNNLIFNCPSCVI